MIGQVLEGAARTYVRSHYVLLLLGLAIAAGWFALHEHDARIRSEAQWHVKYSAADSALRVRDRELDTARSHTDVVTHTVTRLLASVGADSGWRHDTVYVAGDSAPRYAVPIPTVVLQDSLNRACSLLAVTCKLEREAAIADRDAVQHKLDVALAKPERSCVHAFWFGAAAGAAGDELAHGRLKISLPSLHF